MKGHKETKVYLKEIYGCVDASMHVLSSSQKSSTKNKPKEDPLHSVSVDLSERLDD